LQNRRKPGTGGGDTYPARLPSASSSNPFDGLDSIRARVAGMGAKEAVTEPAKARAGSSVVQNRPSHAARKSVPQPAMRRITEEENAEEEEAVSSESTHGGRGKRSRKEPEWTSTGSSFFLCFAAPPPTSFCLLIVCFTDTFLNPTERHNRSLSVDSTSSTLYPASHPSMDSAQQPPPSPSSSRPRPSTTSWASAADRAAILHVEQLKRQWGADAYDAVVRDFEADEG
jgi:hypothetical protein